MNFLTIFYSKNGEKNSVLYLYPIPCLASLPISTKETEHFNEDLSCDI